MGLRIIAKWRSFIAVVYSLSATYLLLGWGVEGDVCQGIFLKTVLLDVPLII